MPFVYILKSEKDGRLYVGATTNVAERLKSHNAGKVKSTKPRRPLILVYEREFGSLTEARKFEWTLKCTPWGGKLKKELANGQSSEVV